MSRGNCLRADREPGRRTRYTTYSDALDEAVKEIEDTIIFFLRCRRTQQSEDPARSYFFPGNLKARNTRSLTIIPSQTHNCRSEHRHYVSKRRDLGVEVCCEEAGLLEPGQEATLVSCADQHMVCQVAVSGDHATYRFWFLNERKAVTGILTPDGPFVRHPGSVPVKDDVYVPGEERHQLQSAPTSGAKRKQTDP